MYCKYCGQKIDDDSIYCRDCGKQVGNNSALSNDQKINKKNEFKSREELLECASLVTSNYRPGDKSLLLYLGIIKKHSSHNNIVDLFNDPDYFNLVFDTLCAWNMNQRAAKLKPADYLARISKDFVSDFEKLYEIQFENLDQESAENMLVELKPIFTGLMPMGSASQLVGTAKLLHFILPNLIMPMDRKFTMNFFYGHNGYSDNVDKEFEIFKKTYLKFVELAHRFNLSSQDLDPSWNTTVPKLLDNAIIGKVLYS